MRGDVTELLQQLYYGHQCHIGCTHDIITLADDGIDDILKDFALALHSGELDGNGIHAGLYSDTARKLTEAITKGMGKVSFGFDDPMNELRSSLLSNIHQFSAVKSYHQNQEFKLMLFDDNGQLESFNSFKNKIAARFGFYNQTALSAEYDNSLASSQMAVLWNHYNDDDLLEYSTAGDDRVRDEHKLLDGITLPKNSNFWKSYYPPNGWRCRCTVIPGVVKNMKFNEAEASSLGKKSIKHDDLGVFKNNTGISEIIFKNDHPFYRKADKEFPFDAVKNYGFKTTEQIFKNANLPVSLHIDTVDDYYKWWDSMVALHGVSKTDFVLKDPLNCNILFDSGPGRIFDKGKFRDHILRKRAEKRYEFAANLKDIITAPDEVWSKDNDLIYLKFYKGGMYSVLVERKENKLIAGTMWKANDKGLVEDRRGILMYKK